MAPSRSRTTSRAGGAPKRPLALAAELRRVAVAHAAAGARDVEVLAEHEATRLLEAQLLLELQGAHRRDRPEAVVEARDAPPDLPEKSAFDDPTLLEIARQHSKSAAQVMLRWHLQEGRSAIPKSPKPTRIAENFDVFDFEHSSEQVAAIDALDTGVRGGPDPDSITLEAHGRDIPEA